MTVTFVMIPDLNIFVNNLYQMQDTTKAGTDLRTGFC